MPEWRRESFSIRTDSDVAHLALIRAGCGIGVYQLALAKLNADPVRVLPKFELKLETWVRMDEDLRHSPRCRVSHIRCACEGIDRLRELTERLAGRRSMRPQPSPTFVSRSVRQHLIGSHRRLER